MTRYSSKWALLGIASIVALAAGAASAQQDVVDRCRQTSSKDDRIACLEAALMMRGRAAAKVDPSSLSPIAAPEVTEVPVASPHSETTAPVPEEVANVTETTDIGVEQVIARQQTQEERLAALKNAAGLTVVKYEQLAHERLQVTLENGQVWRQIRGDTQKVNPTLKKNRTVDISESSFGGYKLRLNEMQRTIRVQRIR